MLRPAITQKRIRNGTNVSISSENAAMIGTIAKSRADAVDMDSSVALRLRRNPTSVWLIAR
jgi:hypothetical protein